MSADIYHLDTAKQARDALALPICIDSEQTVIGTLLMNNEALSRLSFNVGENDFSEELHRQAWSVAVDLIGSARPATPGSLAVYLGNDEVAEGLSIKAYLARLCAEAMPVEVAVGAAKTVRDLAARRAIIECAGRMDAHARNPTVKDEAASIATSHMMALQGIAASSGNDTTRHIAEHADELMSVVDGVRSGDLKYKIVTTGYSDLDEAISGYVPGTLVVAAGRPGMGKSILANSTGYRCAKSGAGVLEFPLEIGASQMTARHLADIAYSSGRPIAFRDIGRRADALSENDVDRLRRAQDRLRSLPIEIDKRSRVTVAQIGAKVAQVKRAMAARGVELGLVTIDHLDFIHASDRYSGNRTQEIGEICLGLKEIAQTNAVCVLLFSQLSREVEKRTAKEKRPTLADLRNSGDIEQVADVVMFLYREEYYITRSAEYQNGDVDAINAAINASGKLELILAKVRAGPTPTIHLFCDLAASSISSFERGRT